MNHKPRVLFLSVGDSTRSQIAEGFLRTFAGDEFVAMSTATRSLEADPLAREVMQEVGIDISEQRAKDIKESDRALFLRRHGLRCF
jgi:arsenate reductase